MLSSLSSVTLRAGGPLKEYRGQRSSERPDVGREGICGHKEGCVAGDAGGIRGLVTNMEVVKTRQET